MLLVLCVDLDDDVGRKTGFDTPVVGREDVEAAAVELATADPEDSDVNVLFQGIHTHDAVAPDESVEVAAVTGLPSADTAANRRIGEEVDEVIAGLSTRESVRALVVTDGAQDESVVPVIRSRVEVDGVRRVVVRQAQDLESIYYTLKQVLDDPETRGTILIPMGILLLIYPLAVIASLFNLPGLVLGVTSALLGLYLIARGFRLGDTIDDLVGRALESLYAGRVTLITYLVAAALLLVGGVGAVEQLDLVRGTVDDPLGVLEIVAALVFGAIQWFAAAALTTSVGQITDEYLAGRLRWRYLNAPFYVVAIALVGHAVSGFVIGAVDLSYMATVLTAGTLIALCSTLAFAVAESRFPREPEAAA